MAQQTDDPKAARSIAHLTKAEEITPIMTHPEVWGWVMGESGPSPETYQPRLNEGGIYLGNPGRWFVSLHTIPEVDGWLEFHFAAIPGAGLAMVRGIQHILHSSIQVNLVGVFPAYNQVALRVAPHFGFRLEATEESQWDGNPCIMNIMTRRYDHG